MTSMITDFTVRAVAEKQNRLLLQGRSGLTRSTPVSDITYSVVDGSPQTVPVTTGSSYLAIVSDRQVAVAITTVFNAVTTTATYVIEDLLVLTAPFTALTISNTGATPAEVRVIQA